MARHSVEEHVRWEDIDAAGIINYQAYLRFFGLAEVEMLRSCGITYGVLVNDFAIWLPRARVECNFHHPVTLDELLVVDSFFGKVGRTSLHINFEVHRKGDPHVIVATGVYVLVAVNKASFEPVPLPPSFRKRIAKYVEAPPAKPFARR